MNRTTEQLQFWVKNTTDLNGKPRILVCLHPDDQPVLLDRIIGLLEAQREALIYSFESVPADGDSVAPDLSEERVAEVVADMQLVVAVVTRRMLTEPNAALDRIVPYAQAHNVPVLPLMMEPDGAQLYQKRFGDLQYLMPDDPDRTALPFDQKLAAYLEEVLVSDETAQRMRDAFDALVFLSYRKKDRAYASELMRMVHRNPRLRDVAFWYDEFLIPGEDFNEGIQGALDESDLFALVVTPSLLENPNYVMQYEYPAARAAGKSILPVLMERLSKAQREEFARLYRDVPQGVDASGGVLLAAALMRKLQRLAVRTGPDDAQHTFLIGLAYLDGIRVEVDQKRAVALIREAAEAGLTEAMRKLSSMYRVGKGVARSLDASIDWQLQLCEAMESRYRADGSDDNLRELLADTATLGDCLYRAKQVRDLLYWLFKQQDWTEEAVRRGFADGKRALAMCYSKIAETMTMLDQDWEGVKQCRKAIELFDALLAEEPSDAARKDAYIAHRLLGQFHQRRREWEEAVSAFRDARIPLLALESEEYRESLMRDVAGLWRLEGDALTRLFREDEADACYEQAREASEALFARRPDAAGRRSLINTYERLELSRRRHKDYDTARAYCCRRLELLKEALAEAQESGLRQNDLYVELAAVQEDLGEKAEALDSYHAALETPEEDPTSTESRETKVEALRALSRLAYNGGDERRARAYFQEMIAEIQHLYEDTHAPEYLETLSYALALEANRQKGGVPDIRMLEQAFDVQQQLWDQVHSFDCRARRDFMRDRLDQLYEQYPAQRRPWVALFGGGDEERATMAAHLERLGLRVAYNTPMTEDFARTYTEVRPDLVLLGMSGDGAHELYWLTFLLRSLEPDACVFLIGDPAARDCMEQGVAAGAKGYLVRPFTMRQLRKRVRALLG